MATDRSDGKPSVGQHNTTVLFDFDVLEHLDEAVRHRQRALGRPSRSINRSAILNEIVRGVLSRDNALIPLVGRVAGGEPITAQENIECDILLPERLTGGATFALTVAGNSMEPAIHNGEIVLVRQQETAENGEVVVALLGEEEGTVKRFYRRDHEAELRPENPHFQTIRSADIRIAGKVVGVLGVRSV